jgi:hypothetical protein
MSAKSPTLHELSNNEDLSEDDDLPDVRFQDSFSSTPTLPINGKSTVNNKLSKNPTSSPLTTAPRAQIITGNYETVLNFKEKFVILFFSKI